MHSNSQNFFLGGGGGGGGGEARGFGGGELPPCTPPVDKILIWTFVQDLPNDEYNCSCNPNYSGTNCDIYDRK